MRKHRSASEVFTFGGRLPPAVGGLIVAIVLGALFRAWGPDWIVGRLGLDPLAVRYGEVWRLVTWVFFSEPDPLGLVFAVVVLWWLGRDLYYAWERARFLATWFGLAALTGLVVTGLALVWPPLASHGLRFGWWGPWPMIDALTIAWAMIFPDRQILLMMAVPVSGRALMWITLGGTLLYAALMRSPVAFAPHLVAQLLMLAYARGWSLRGVWQTIRIRQYERRARRRASHLRVVKKQDPPRWLN